MENSLKQRFFAYVDVRGEDECWNWIGTADPKGYGKFNKVGGRNGKDWRSHRFSYLLHYGVDPGPYWVLHSCDNPACVNPRHLRLGSSLENNQERAQKGRNRNATVNSPIRNRTEKGKSGPKGRPIEERFWEKVDKRSPGECWNWIAKVDKDGYGRIGTGSRTNKSSSMIRAPRFSYLFHYGVDPGELNVLHSCDNPACVNPAHLRLGTLADNNRDTLERGHHATISLKGIDNPYSKLTESQVSEIRSRYRTGDISQQELAQEYGVGQTCISCIVTGKSWKHVN